MMDQKSWLWRKKSSEKITVSSDETLVMDKARLEKDLEIANDKLSVALSECKKKDEVAKIHADREQEAVAGWEKTKAEVASLKQELNDAVQKRIAGEERVVHLDAALKECMQQLRFVREEQEQRIHDALAKTSKEYEKSQMVLEEKLTDAGKTLSKLGTENTQLSKALLVKEKIVEDLNRQLAAMEADLNSMVSRLESIEKDNGSLKYEVRVLEKEVEIRNEEREFNRRTTDASHKQHLESVKKIAKLESECQRLRLLVRKRLPGPAALVKMKNEVEMLGRDPFQIRRRQSYPADSSSLENSPETPNKRITSLTTRVSALEEENNALKEALNTRNNEVQILKTVNARASFKSLPVESLHQSSNGHKIMESGRSLASMSDTGSDDKVSCAESWASALISELEHFKNGKQKGLNSGKIVKSSDLDLMDDFVEMEKLAIVSVEKPTENSETLSNEVNGKPRSLEIDAMSEDASMAKVPDWIQNIVKIVFEQSGFLQKDPEKVLEDIRSAMKYRYPAKVIDTKESTNHCDESAFPCDGGCKLRKPLVIDSTNVANEKCNQHQEDFSKSISKLIEVVEGISLASSDDDNSASRKDGNLYSETSRGYTVRVLQWKTSELSAILKQFINSCYDLLNGKAEIINFLQELNSCFDWIMNHCFSLQDVSSMRDSIKKRFDWDESRSDCELEIGTMVNSPEVEKSRVFREQVSWLKKGAASNSISASTEELQSTLTEENRRLKEESVSVESAKKDIETLTNKLQESEDKTVNLQKEFETLPDLKGTIESQIVNQQLVNQDLDAQLTAARIELNETHRKFSAVQVELENKNNCIEELEATCLELQLQLESTGKQNPSADLSREEKQMRTEWEITTASEKLAECQETILNLGKQLKALATPKEAALLDKVITTPNDEMDATTISPPTAVAAAESTAIVIATDANPTEAKVKTINNRFSLLDQMLAEDDAVTREHKFPKTVEVDNLHTSSESEKAIDPQKAILIWSGHKNGGERDSVGTLAIVPSISNKRGDSGLWRKLLWRRKRVKSHKKSLPFAAA